MTYLVDNNQNLINSWEHDTELAGMTYISPDSILYAPCKISYNQSTPNYNGRFKKMNWDGEVIWDFILSN